MFMFKYLCLKVHFQIDGPESSYLMDIYNAGVHTNVGGSTNAGGWVLGKAMG